MVCHEVVYSGNKANCISDETGILTVSSNIAPKRPGTLYEYALIDLNEIHFNYHEVINEKLELFDEHLNAYAAYKIEEKIKYNIEKQKNKCKECINAFVQDEKINDQFIARKMSNLVGPRSQPCKSTVDIIKAANKIHNHLPGTGYESKAIIKTILQHLDYDNLFMSTEFQDHTYQEIEEADFSHKENFIINIVNAYINMKSHGIYSKLSDEQRGEYIRHSYRKETHFKGQ